MSEPFFNGYESMPRWCASEEDSLAASLFKPKRASLFLTEPLLAESSPTEILPLAG